MDNGSTQQCKVTVSILGTMVAYMKEISLQTKDPAKASKLGQMVVLMMVTGTTVNNMV